MGGSLLEHLPVSPTNSGGDALKCPEVQITMAKEKTQRQIKRHNYHMMKVLERPISNPISTSQFSLVIINGTAIKFFKSFDI